MKVGGGKLDFFLKPINMLTGFIYEDSSIHDSADVKHSYILTYIGTPLWTHNLMYDKLKASLVW